MNDTLKWIALIAALTGGTNAAQYLGLAAPAEQEVAETQANSDTIRSELSACMAELRKCYSECR